MKLFIANKKMYVVFLSLFFLKSFAQENDFMVEIPSEMSIREIKEACNNLSHDENAIKKLVIEVDLDNEENVRAHFVWNRNARKHGQYLGYPRPYLQPLTKNEKNDIRFIITTLANNSIFSIAAYRSELESAGDRIDHIHPLNFLAFVFTNEELKVGIKNIRGKGWIWGDFIGNLKTTLNTEWQIGNIKDEYIHDFSKKVKLNSKSFLGDVQKKNWDGFIQKLIDIKRDGDHDRYDD